MNEYDQIRNMLSKVRLIKESNEMGSPNNNTQIQQPIQQQQPMQQTPSGKKVQFDDINTIGFINGDSIRDDIKNQVTSAIGAFIKASGLLLDTININIEHNRINMSSNTVKNPGMESVKSITFNTDEESPKLELNQGILSVTRDLATLLQTITTTFNDNQIGKNKLIMSTQGNIQ